MSVMAPAPPAAPPEGRAPGTIPAPEGGRGAAPVSPLVIAELALAGMTMTAVAGLWRLFADGSFLVPVAFFALLAHGLAALCRRRGLGGGTTAVVATAGILLTASWFLLPETTAYGIPTLDTLAEAGRRLSSAWTLFHDVRAPAPVEPGFVLASVIAVWAAAFAADTAAFRTGAVIEAVAPAATLFVFGAALGAPWHRGLTTALFLLALLGYWLTQRALSSASTPTWLARDDRRGRNALARGGTGLAVAGVLGALLLGPLLPGSGATALIPWRASDRNSDDRVTISPLVDIRTRIVNQADIEVFTVKSSERSYWRLTSLESFDGRIWSSEGSYGPADGSLGSAVPLDRAVTTTVTQEFQIKALASIWLPAAFRPVAVEGADARYDPDSHSLLTEEETSDGLAYAVESELAALTEEELALVPEDVPAEITAVYTPLPASFPTDVQILAEDVVDGARTPYEMARRLQDFFRQGFTYTLDVPEGHSDNALEHFLFESQAGYCEQFAGAYAAMARSVGLPARVAVGFTPGELTEAGTYSVRGSNGHAWPEVYLAGYGWVPFEPTPGRGIPSGEAYTGVPEQQADAGDPGSATTTSSTTVTTLAPGATATTGPTPGGPGFDELGDNIGTTVTAPSPWPRRLLVAAIVLVVSPVVWAIGLAVALAVRRHLRRRRAVGPGERVLVAWTEVGEALGQLGAPPRPAETPAEYARRAGQRTKVAPRLLEVMAAVVTVAEYSPVEFDEELARSAQRAAAAVEQTVTDRLAVRARLWRLVDPGLILADRGPRRHINDTRPEGPGRPTPLS